MKMQKNKVPYSSILKRIEDEVKNKWPEEYISLVGTNIHNHISYLTQFHNSPASAIATDVEPNINNEILNEVQENADPQLSEKLRGSFCKNQSPADCRGLIRKL